LALLSDVPLARSLGFAPARARLGRGEEVSTRDPRARCVRLSLVRRRGAIGRLPAGARRRRGASRRVKCGRVLSYVQLSTRRGDHEPRRKLCGRHRWGSMRLR